MVRAWRRAVLLSGSILLISPLHLVVPAQQDTGAPVFRLQVRRVPVDVIVLDKNGNPARGLKKDDFTVKEDNKPQQILSFDDFDGSRPEFIPPATPPLPPNTFINLPKAPERGPLYILYYDMVNTPKEDQMIFRAELLKFIDKAQPGTRIALLVNAAGLHMIQGFTSEHTLLRDAVLRNGPGPHIPQVFLNGNVYGTNDAGGCLSNLNFISEYMIGIPGRKSLIWLASYFPIPVSPSMSGLSTQMAGQGPSSFSIGAQGGPQVLDLTELERENIQRTYTAMMKSQIALYPVDLRGVAGAGAKGVAADSLIDRENFDMIAEATGGRAMYGSNHPADLIEKAVEHGESYYTLTYHPANDTYDGSERHIQIALAKRNDYQLTFRHVYYALGDDVQQKEQNRDPLQARFLAAKAQDTLWANIEHGAPMLHDLLFTVHLATDGPAHTATADQMRALQDAPEYFITRRRKPAANPPPPIKLQRYVIDYGVIDPQLKAAEAHRDGVAAIEFAAAAYNADGRLLNSILNQGIPSGVKRKSSALFHAVQDLEVPAGAAYIRLAVRDTTTNRTGTLEISLPLERASDTADVAASQNNGK